MENESHAGKVFNIENCRAEYHTADLVDCLSPTVASSCGYALAFGNGFFCKHLRRNDIIENTKKLQGKISPPPDVSQSDNQ